MIPNFPWFAPYDGLAWALIPVTLEGRLLTLVTYTLFLAVIFVHGASKRSVTNGMGLIAFFAAIVIMTSLPSIA